MTFLLKSRYEMLLASFCLAVYLMAYALSQAPENLKINTCVTLQRCNSCISVPGCAWCMKESIPRGIPRCNLRSDLNCSDMIYYPENEKHVMENKSSDETGSLVQLKPQHIKIKLRPNEPFTFKVTFRQAEDYPIDLYYLMDVTYSMKEHKDMVASLADVLTDTMKGFTKNFRVGFGSFIDKVVMPYADMTPKRLKNPCPDIYCIPPYGFRNHLSLTDDVRLFKAEVLSANLSGNLDNAEGGFDAIMQVAACKNEIGWMQRSRKILLFTTDSIFHYAGDGKLGGIVKPNDEQCHLDSNGLYTESIYQDYPSLSQIIKKVEKEKINLIFAVSENLYETYETMSSFIEGSHTGELTKNSSNIVDLLKDQYNKIRSEVELKDQTPSFMKIKYYSNCLGPHKRRTNICSGLKVGESVEFDVEIQLIECPKTREEFKQSFRISPVGVNEYLEVDVELMCKCDCESPEQKFLNDTRCSEHGVFECGICSCEPSFYGRKCECSTSEIEKHTEQCKRADGSICSRKGDCVCGECHCYQNEKGTGKYYGDFCQCNDFSCQKGENGEVCSGLERGSCCNDECNCNPGWSGPACECSEDISTCINPLDKDHQVCSGRGQCVCGQCQCSNENEGYRGQYCEDCPSCEGRCTEFRGCVQCKVFKTGQLSAEACKANCSLLTIREAPTAEVSAPDERKCIFRDDDNCNFFFKYYYNRYNKPVIDVQSTKDCAKQAEVTIIIGSTAAGVFFIGLVCVMILRLVVYVKDKRDYEKFKKEVQSTRWGDQTNPIFKGAEHKYQNPLYEGYKEDSRNETIGSTNPKRRPVRPLPDSPYNITLYEKS